MESNLDFLNPVSTKYMANLNIDNNTKIGLYFVFVFAVGVAISINNYAHSNPYRYCVESSRMIQ